MLGGEHLRDREPEPAAGAGDEHRGLRQGDGEVLLVQPSALHQACGSGARGT